MAHDITALEGMPPFSEFDATPVAQFGEFKVLRVLGKGGMATVTVATPPPGRNLPAYVALKFLHRKFLDDADIIDSFEQEARLGMLLQHENLCRTYQLEKVQQRIGIVMEYLDGYPLAYLNRYLHNVEESMSRHVAVAHLVAKLARGLHELHTLKSPQGIWLGAVHRDVSAQNIIITSDGRPKLVDFGVAFSKDRKLKTKTGFIKGKLAYLSPEYLLGREWNHRVDIWSLGVVLWQLLAGRRLFHPADTRVLMKEIMTGSIAPPSHHARSVPPELDNLVLEALERDPRKRISSMAEMADRLDRIIREETDDPENHVRWWLETIEANMRPSGVVRRKVVAQPQLFTEVTPRPKGGKIGGGRI